MTLFSPTNLTDDIYRYSQKLFDNSWTKEPVRKLRIRVSNLIPDETVQLSFFDKKDREKQLKLDNTIDLIRGRYGKSIIIRGALLNSGVSAMTGGIQDDYLMMASII